MIKNKVNKVITSKAFFIVISILFSIMLWFYVVNVENKEITKQISGIKVTFLGADDILADRQLIIRENQQTQTVTLKLMGRRSILSNMTADDITVSVDLTDIRNTGALDRAYTISFNNGIAENEDIYILNKDPVYITVEVDKLIRKPVLVKGLLDSSEGAVGVAEGFMAGPFEFDPETITVSGPEDVISQISEALVVVRRENLQKTVSGMMKYVFIDENGNTIESEAIKVDTDTVSVTLPIYMIKDVVLSVGLIEGGGATSANTVVTVNPEVVMLSGDPAILSGINTITLGTIDISDFEYSYTNDYTIAIPNGVENLSGEIEATVTVTIKGLETKRILATRIEMINVPEGFTANAITTYKEVTIRGPAEIVELIDAHNIRIVADLSALGQTTGRYSVPARVDIDGYSEAGAVGKYNIVVSLDPKQEEPEPD